MNWHPGLPLLTAFGRGCCPLSPFRPCFLRRPPPCPAVRAQRLPLRRLLALHDPPLRSATHGPQRLHPGLLPRAPPRPRGSARRRRRWRQPLRCPARLLGWLLGLAAAAADPPRQHHACHRRRHQSPGLPQRRHAAAGGWRRPGVAQRRRRRRRRQPHGGGGVDGTCQDGLRHRHHPAVQVRTRRAGQRPGLQQYGIMTCFLVWGVHMHRCLARRGRSLGRLLPCPRTACPSSCGTALLAGWATRTRRGSRAPATYKGRAVGRNAPKQLQRCGTLTARRAWSLRCRAGPCGASGTGFSHGFRSPHKVRSVTMENNSSGYSSTTCTQGCRAYSGHGPGGGWSL